MENELTEDTVEMAIAEHVRRAVEDEVLRQVIEQTAALRATENKTISEMLAQNAFDAEFKYRLDLNERAADGRMIVHSTNGGPDILMTDAEAAQYFDSDLHFWPTVQERGGRMHKGFRPLSDQVLVRPLPAQDRISSSSLIVIPGNHDRGRLDNKLGVVLALGPGDPVAVKCEACDGRGETGVTARWTRTSFTAKFTGGTKCGPCDGTGFTGQVVRTPFEVAVGDTVLYAPRGWAEITLDGESLIVLHDCQTILAVVDPDTVLFAEDQTTKKKGPDWVK